MHPVKSASFQLALDPAVVSPRDLMIISCLQVSTYPPFPCPSVFISYFPFLLWFDEIDIHKLPGSWNRESEVKWREVTQSCLTLWGPVDCSLPGSSVHGILQARILEWVAISFPRGSSRPRDPTWVSHIGGRCFNLWATSEAHVLGKLWTIIGRCMFVRVVFTFSIWDFKSLYITFSTKYYILLQTCLPE